MATTRAFLFGALGLVLALALACGDGTAAGERGFATPEAASRALLEALSHRRAEDLEAVFPNRHDLAETVPCAGINFLLLYSRSARSRLADLIREQPADLGLTWLRLEDGEPSDRAVLAAGTALGPCTANQETTLAWGDLRFRVERGGAATEERMGLRLVRLGEDGPWFVAGFELCALPLCYGGVADRPAWLTP